MSMLTELKAAIAKHGNVARTNRFKVDFTGLFNKGYATLNEIKDLEYFLEDVNMPSKEIENVDYSLYRNKIAYATGYTNGDFGMKFRAPTDMFVKEIFDRWIEDIIPSGDYKLKYRSQIGVDFTITQISDRPRITSTSPQNGETPRKEVDYYSIIVKEAYPISISSIEYSNTQEGEYVTFDVGFAYKDIFNKASRQTLIEKFQRGLEQLQNQLLFQNISNE